MAYTKTQWVNNEEPSINAENLNKMEQGIADAQSSAQWGSITGQLSEQTDLNNELSTLNSNLTSLEDEVDSIGTATSIEDTEPYLFKSSARENVVGNIMSVHKIIGGTVAWNQSVPHTVASRTVYGVTFTNNNDGSWTLTGTSTSNNTFNNLNYSANAKQFTLNHIYLVVTNLRGDNSTALSTIGLWLSGIRSTETGTSDSTQIYGKEYDIIKAYSVTIPSHTRLQVANLSGTDIGTVTMQPQVFDLTQMFGSTIADYIYSLEQATAGAGVAWFKKLFPNDYYPYNAGELISVKTSAHVMRDANNNIIGNYALEPDLELRGIPKIADGKLHYDGDEYEPSGTVTRKYGIVDLGTLTWEKQTVSALNCFNSSITGKKKGGTVICSNYTKGTIYGTSTDKIIGVNLNTNNIYIRDSSYMSGDASAFKSAMSGVYLVYELETPTTETADAYDKQQVFDVTGTEEYVDTRTVPIPVGHDTFFPTSITSRIDALEDEFNEEIAALSESIAPAETGTATQNYATGSYLMLNNRLCKVTSPIATGETIIVGSNVQYTTVAEELTAILAQIAEQI